jgi:uncharacterized protein (TIGR02646 family)
MQAAERRFKASLAAAATQSEHARTQFNCLDKRKLRAVLYAEQRHLCVYCERRVKEKEGSKAPPIEHWRPLSGCPDMALHWRNLYLSCTSASTCDGSKADRRLVWSEADNDLPWPSDASYEEWICFTSGGEAYVRMDAPLDDAKRKALELLIADGNDEGRKRKSILNLNHPALLEARMAAIDAERKRLEKDFPGHTATESDRRARVDAMLDESMYPEFVSIRVAYLNRMLGKGRERAR